MIRLAIVMPSRFPAGTQRRGPRWVWLLPCLLAWVAPASLSAQSQPVDSCVTCHLLLGDERLAKPARDFADDIHQAKGLTCAACHGGDPHAAGVEAMASAKGFIRAPAHRQIPTVCGKCHSDALFMKQYNPQMRIDQAAEYRTSVHGHRLATLNDQKVATCASCHTAHSILPASDARSTVYPLHVPATCAHCHADAAYMSAYGIPTDQYRKYTASVHWTALAKNSDMSAPACNDCHGNHGAVPPGVTSVANVCGQCHSLQADNLEHSAHAPIFVAIGAPGCATCHQKHEIHPTSDQMLGASGSAVCAACHEESDQGGRIASAMRTLIDQLRTEQQRAQAILQRAERSGMEVSQPEFDLNAANEDLIKARAAVHTFDTNAVRKSVEEGLGIARKAYGRGVEALGELQFRRDGLAVSLVIILVVIVGVVLKIRQIERRPGRGPIWRPVKRT
jgi:predicted CXXCH cytochrome family protein